MKGSLRGLTRRLKEEIGASREGEAGDTRILETRRVLTNGENTFDSGLPISFEVVPVVPVVPTFDINGLGWNDQGGSRSFQSFQSIEPAQALGDDQLAEIAGLSEHFGEDAEEAERLLRVEASRVFERGEGNAQSIPHDVMVAGLLAASKVRPGADVGDPHGDDHYEAFSGLPGALLPTIEKKSGGGAGVKLPTHPWADGVAKLQTIDRLIGFSPQQWRQAQYGCATLLASHWEDMTRLGWTVEDAFGLHSEAGGNAVQCSGLGVLLGNGKVIEMTDQSARIVLRTGSMQTFRRRPNIWGTVPIWDAQCWA